MMAQPMRRPSGSQPSWQQRGNLRQIRHATSSGQSAAVRSGVRAAARRHRGDARWRRPEQPVIPAGLDCSDRERRRIASASSPASGWVARIPVSRNCSRASPTGYAAPFCTTAPAIPAAASRFSGARCFWRCLISTGCTASCRRWSAARDTTSPMSTSSIGRAGPACQTTASSIGYGSESWIWRACGG